MAIESLPHIQREQVIHEGLCDGQRQSTEEDHEECYDGELGCHSDSHPRGMYGRTNPLDLGNGVLAGVFQFEPVPQDTHHQVCDPLEEQEADEEDVPAGTVCRDVSACVASSQ